MVVLVYLLQYTERTIIQYLNKEETLEGLLNDEKAFMDHGSGFFNFVCLHKETDWSSILTNLQIAKQENSWIWQIK